MYAEGMTPRSVLLLGALAMSAWAQSPSVPPPRFEDYPVKEIFKGTPARPVLATTEELRFRTVIRQGVTKGWGVVDAATGKEMPRPGPNFAGHYVLITWGCGSPCLMAAIVDAVTGRVYPMPYDHDRPGHSYFQVPWEFPATPLDYRLDSRLLIANICEAEVALHLGAQVGYQSQNCGPHYFLMGNDELTLIHRVLK